MIFFVACGAPQNNTSAAASSLGDAGVVRSDAGGADTGAGAGAVVAAKDGGSEATQPVARVRCGNLRWVPDLCYVRDPGDVTQGVPSDDVLIFDDATWLASQGAKAADVKAHKTMMQLGGMCRAMMLGPDKEAGLFCMYHTQSVGSATESVYRGVQRAHFVTIRKGVRTILLDVPFSFENFDSPGQPEPGEETGIFGLIVETRLATTKIVLAEPRPGACANAAKRAAEDIATRLQQKPLVQVELTTMRFDAKLLTTICASAKTYTWSKGAFR